MKKKVLADMEQQLQAHVALLEGQVPLALPTSYPY